MLKDNCQKAERRLTKKSLKSVDNYFFSSEKADFLASVGSI
jgi:hypothetical protein